MPTSDFLFLVQAIALPPFPDRMQTKYAICKLYVPVSPFPASSASSTSRFHPTIFTQISMVFIPGKLLDV